MSGNEEREQHYPLERRWVIRAKNGRNSYIVVGIYLANVIFGLYAFGPMSCLIWSILTILWFGVEFVERQHRGPSIGFEPEPWMSKRAYEQRERDLIVAQWDDAIVRRIDAMRTGYLERLAEDKYCSICHTRVTAGDVEEGWYEPHNVCMRCYLGQTPEEHPYVIEEEEY